MKTSKIITPEQLNRQLTITRFCLAILTTLIIYAAITGSKSSNNELIFQKEVNPIDVVPPEYLNSYFKFNQNLEDVIIDQNLDDGQRNVLKSISCEFINEFYPENLNNIRTIDENSRLYSLGKYLEDFAERIMLDSIQSHGFVSPNDEILVKQWKNVAFQLKEFKYK
jgi:hypothetical protein